MKNLRNFALAAFALLGFAACQQEEFAPEIKNPTHSVTFVAGAPETKTTVDISDGATAKFAWTKADENKFTVYENGTAAKKTIGALGVDGKMTLTATFEGTSQEGDNSYIAILNKSGNATQIVTEEAYDEAADIMVSKAVSSFADESGVLLQFRREVAIAQMTLRGLDAREVVNIVTVSSTADIAGSYDVKGWVSPAASSIEISSTSAMEVGDYKIVANEAGEAVVWFTCIPQDEATLTVKVEAADGDKYTKTFSKPITLTRGDVKAFGVAMEKDVVAKPWVAVELADIDETMPLVITMAKEGTTYALSLTDTDDNALGTSKAPKAIEVSVVDGKLSEEPSSDILWNIANNNGNLTIYPNGVTNEWLYTIAKNDGVRLGTNTSNGSVWSIDAESGYLKANVTTSEVRYLGVYTITPDWRAYTNTTGNTANQTLRFYSNASPKTALATPTNLTVSAEKLVSWDVVNGAKSYVLTIGTEEYPCLSNSYNASAIADEYYDVAVVAVPSDTENYKNSVAATLTDAKFGTPTLKTPTLNEGAVDEFSVNATWTVDPRATAGYNCELYKGETKVGDSKTVTTGSVSFKDLDDGVTYTVKVNAIAVEGTKAYAASGVATIDLTTKGTTKISDINAAGTYTVKNAVVYAVANTGVVIIGDGTGLMLLEKNSHGYKVGDTFSTVAGTVAVSNGIWKFNSPTVGTKTLGSAPDYGTPVEATSDYLASKPNKVVYVHARGSQSGRYITVGTEKLYMSKANTTYDGKDVDAYGFIYGYSTQYSNTFFCVTSIAEDPTVPKLSVTPTSKTWESYETDAAVFKVTTNTAGVKDWSVSPEALTWAEIAIDKDAGTIKVTPNGPNTTDDAFEETLTVYHAADNTLTETITLTQKKAASTGGTTPTEQTVFLETFGSTNSTPEFNTYTGYSATAEMFTTSGNVNTHYSGSGKIGKNSYSGVNISSGYTDASGNSGCFHLGTKNTEDTILQISDINITNCVNISVSFGALGGSKDHKVSVYYKIDGGAETALITNGAITNERWTLLNANISGTGESLTLIFKHKPSKAWTIRMDDIKVLGTK